ncbi:hypothetical protein HQQ94_16220 [Shewanella sp. VB17]|uniref:hypothetical protein n=1 Tax=Shewanella sp. VB17 TaxID=2739432 RepID=UPI001567C648|nr:hypothetical protein [Shewanella sp. VB17]NRD74736.1 hypothetical protein [Shewanella sp. VB17]
MPALKHLFLSLLALVPFTSIGQTSLKYHITVDPDNLDQLNVSVDTRALTNASVLPARTMRSSTQPKLSCINANGTRTAIDYQQAIQCSSVVWVLPLHLVDKNGFDPATQIDSRDANKGWYFVSEMNSLPRFNDLSKSEEIQSSLICIPDNTCYKLPSQSLPPLLLVWGQETTQLNINNKLVTIHSDSPLVIEHLQSWKPSLVKQLNYLNQVFPNHNLKQWQIAFFSRDKSASSVGGAAGNNLILINALLDQGKLSHDSIQMMLKIAAHESVHILNSHDMPTWAGESLAEYYALKSLQGTEFAVEDATTRWHQFATTFPYAKTGLLAADQAVNERQEYQYYPLFYLKGPAFWHEIDNALIHTDSSLETWLARLTFNDDNQFTKKWINELTKQIGKDSWKHIEKRYL